MDMGKLLVAIAVGIVFVVLCLGLYTLWKGGADLPHLVQ